MTYRRSNIWTRVAIGVVLAIIALSTASAQAPSRQAGPPYRPAAGAKDLGAVLFNWTWAMGMLRGLDEHELVATLEYQAQRHHSGGRAALHAHEVSHQQQLPDLGSADSVHLHPRQRTDVFQRRSRQWRIRLERRHPGCGNHRGEREGHAASGRSTGAAHPPVGESAGRAQGRAGRRNGSTRVRAQPRRTCTGRRLNGWEDVRLVGKRASPL